MIKLSNKAISAISITSAGIIAGGSITAGVVINQTKQEEEKEKTDNPLGRDKNYHKYSLTNKIRANTKLANLIKLQKIDKSFIYLIDEQRFVSNIKTIVQEALQNISVFSKDWSSYKLEIHYKVENTTTVLIDIVWYLPNSKTKYYDQFKLVLEVY